jgi:hypothetical protein
MLLGASHIVGVTPSGRFEYLDILLHVAGVTPSGRVEYLDFLLVNRLTVCIVYICLLRMFTGLGLGY